VAARLYILTYPEASYDDAAGFVVRATSALNARNIVADAPRAEGPGLEGKNVWLDPGVTTCKTLRPERGEYVVLMRDFRAG